MIFDACILSRRLLFCYRDTYALQSDFVFQIVRVCSVMVMWLVRA